MASFPQQFGPYQLEDLIARGGMAEVYRATMQGASTFSRTVAIKKILPHLVENEGFITMLIDEAQLVVGLNHAHIAQVYDLGKIDETYYVAMEYVHGVDVSTMIKTLQERDEIVPFEHTTYILSCMCMGLHVAHHARDAQGQPMNIVHRDVSPHNVLVSFSGDVKVIDFGVAKADRRRGDATEIGILKGKLLYMAPEQAMVKELDGRADLFSAGLVMYKMLTLALPFEGENEFQVYGNILNKEIQPPKLLNPQIPEELNQICMTLLQRDPDRRYQDGLSAKQALDRALHRLSPGYTPARLGRFVEDSFSAQFLQKQADAKAAQDPLAQTMGHAAAGPTQPAYVQLHEPPTAPVDGRRLKEESGNSLPAPTETPAHGWPANTNQFAAEHLASFSAGAEPPISGPARRRRPPLVLFAVLFMALLFGGLVLALILMPDQGPARPLSQDPAPAPTSLRSVPQEPVIPASLDLSFDSTPSGATVLLQGAKVGTTPYRQEQVNPATLPLTFVIDKEGHLQRSVTLTQQAPRLDTPLTLVPTPPAPKPLVAEQAPPHPNLAPKQPAAPKKPKSTPKPPATAPKPEPTPPLPVEKAATPPAPPAKEELASEENPQKDVKFIDIFATPAAPKAPSSESEEAPQERSTSGQKKPGNQAKPPKNAEEDLEWDL